VRRKRGRQTLVATDEQTLTGQSQRLSAAGCEKLFEEKISGAARNRPKLEKPLDQLRKDDVLVVTRKERGITVA